MNDEIIVKGQYKKINKKKMKTKKRKIQSNQTKKIKNKTRYISGGKVIASGGFGCVFSPALKCEGNENREENKISKLMTEKHAIQEYEEVVKIKEKHH